MADLTPHERAALGTLLPSGAQQTGQLHDGLVAAARITWERRVENSELGVRAPGVLHRDVNSWRIVEHATGISAATTRRCAAPPKPAPAPPSTEQE